VERKRNETPTRGTKWNETEWCGTKAERNQNPWNESGTKPKGAERKRNETKKRRTKWNEMGGPPMMLANVLANGEHVGEHGSHCHITT
jgi:hypothetical protein